MSPEKSEEGIDRYPPLGYYNYAASYHVAADLIAEQGLRATHSMPSERNGPVAELRVDSRRGFESCA